MLDYAASFANDWTAERLRVRRVQRFGALGTEACETEMIEFLAFAEPDDEVVFWENVQRKIDAGEFRLLFVADRLSPTLVRIIEYLNGQLRTAEVLGVEILLHAGAAGGPVAYQPVVPGRSTPTARRKATEARTKDEFDEMLLANQGQAVLEGVNQLVDRALQLGGWLSFGASANNPALYINFWTNDGPPTYWPILVTPQPGKLIVKILKLRRHPAFEDPGVQDGLLTRVTAATGSAIQGNTDGSPWVPISTVANPGVVDKLAEVLGWVVAVANGGS